MNNMRRKVFLILSIIMTLIIWINSLLPADLSSAQSGFVVNLVQGFFSWFNIELEINQLSLLIRKLAHFTEFFILGVLWFFTIHEKQELVKKTLILALSISIMTAVIDESIQLFSEGRAFSIIDIGIDGAGTLFGLLIAYFISHMINKRGGLYRD